MLKLGLNLDFGRGCGLIKFEQELIPQSWIY